MSFTFKTIQGTYPGAGAGSRVTFDLSQAMNDGAGTQIEAVRRTMYLDDLTASGSISIAANDDVSTNPVGTSYVVTEHINGAPDRSYRITVLAAATSPIQLATIPHASGGTATYGVNDITSSSLTVTHPTPGIVNIEDPGGGGGGSAHIIEDEGTPLTARAKLNFIGAGVTATDNAGANSTDVTIPSGGPPSGAAGGSLAGTYPNPTIAAGAITATEVAAANKDGTAGTPSLRTLGTGAQQAAAGNDARLSDARVPSTPTTKGDLVGFSTVPARVPAGTNGQQLIADSAQALGVRWDTIVKEFSWTATGYGYFQAGTAMTLDQAVTPNGTFAYDKAVAGALGTFSSASLPVTLAAGDVLRVNCSALANSYGALVLKRTA